MKAIKTSSIVSLILFIAGALFIWFRKVDGSGAINDSANKLLSLGIWSILFLVIFAIILIVYLVQRSHLK
ncbi:DUF3923 family protein [Xylocopilactobacillus apicola]|uniref:DUF3923 domain-containing protein n=1 Tax=Xylocopilactobacillus apicola TaxID=2932184 RepID=A0AAU9D7N7_9LACO|nr:DUF3923 family protein [Xylocopilactobacillus apicola]BDR59563.1 hypothetical protein XA3_20040 [Xylocopilactobacillus apicola]